MDWHRPCLRCVNEKCNKQLTPGSHSVASHFNFYFRKIQISKKNFVLKKHAQIMAFKVYGMKELTN